MFRFARSCGCVAVRLICAVAATPAMAQDVDEVVVTGQREAQRAAIEVKRESLQVVDAVSADDIGKLPDHNTAAALRRIPAGPPLRSFQKKGEGWPVDKACVETPLRG